MFQEFVHRDVAWVQAISLWEDQHPPLRRRIDLGPNYVGLPQTMADISAGTSFIRCNFDPGQPWDVQEIFRNLPGSSSRLAVKVAYCLREPHYFFPKAPLPSRHELVLRRKGLKCKTERSRHYNPINNSQTRLNDDRDSDVRTTKSAYSERSWPTQSEQDHHDQLMATATPWVG